MDYDEMFKQPDYNPAEPDKIKIVQDWIAKHKLKRVLDVDCGRGHYLKRTGADGLEPSSYLCEHDLKGWPVTNSTILDFPQANYDGLYCMDVLEHLTNIEVHLDKLKSLAPLALYGIANHSDKWRGIELHVIQQSLYWWDTLLKQHYAKVKLIQNRGRFFILECSQ